MVQQDFPSSILSALAGVRVPALPRESRGVVMSANDLMWNDATKDTGKRV